MKLSYIRTLITKKKPFPGTWLVPIRLFEPITSYPKSGVASKRQVIVKCIFNTCSNKRIYDVSNISWNHIKTCGKHTKFFRDLIAYQKNKNWYGIGKKFGKSTVIDFLWLKKGCAIFLCKCDCGNYYFTQRSCLIHGSFISCGCVRFGAKRPEKAKQKSKEYFLNKRLNFINKKYGRLTILDVFVVERKYKTKIWKGTWAKVKCDCGNIKNIDLYRIKKGKAKSCGCFAQETAKKTMLKFHSQGINWDATKNTSFCQRHKLFRIRASIRKDRTQYKGEWVCKKCSLERSLESFKRRKIEDHYFFEGIINNALSKIDKTKVLVNA